MVPAQLEKIDIGGAWVQPNSPKRIGGLALIAPWNRRSRPRDPASDRAGLPAPVARRLRAGTVNLNDPAWDRFAPFGEYQQSGNRRAVAQGGIDDFCAVKGIVGWGA